MIAGFDMEHNQLAADGTTYDNGYGICMIPQANVAADVWNVYNTVAGAYMSSTIHTVHLPNIVTKLQNVLGSHIVNRNVLLSSSTNGSNHSSAYTWTNAYATLMSVGQLTGTFASHNNKYDDGEANYKLPIFNCKDYYTVQFWVRGVWGYVSSSNKLHAWFARYGGGFDHEYVRSSVGGIRPLIYLR